MKTTAARRIEPSPGIAGVVAYRVPKHGAPIDLKLDANEGAAPDADLLQRIAAIGPDVMRRYPDASELQALIASRLRIDKSQLIVTAGADDALDRLCRAVLAPGRQLLLTNPSFEMLPRYARIAGAVVREVPWWSGPFPTEQFIAALTPETALVAVVSPNNPTGTVATRADLQRLSDAAPQSVLLLDHAYVEFADEDLTDFALTLPNTIIVRTMSKAWGLAGLRVGYAIGPAEIISWMRASGGPYAVSRPSIALAAARIEADRGATASFIEAVRHDRVQLHALLDELGISHTPSEANFVFTTSGDAAWIRDALAGLGISVRAYPGHPDLDNCLRITCPGDATQCKRLLRGLRAAVAPERLLVESTEFPELGLRVSIPMEDAAITLQEASPRPAWILCARSHTIRTARAAGVVPIAVATTESESELISAGAARVLKSVNELEKMLP